MADSQSDFPNNKYTNSGGGLERVLGTGHYLLLKLMKVKGGQFAFRLLVTSVP